MDPAVKSLDAILNSDEYVKIPGIPIFDEHDEFDDKGNLIRRFDKERLEAIVKTSNEKIKKSGDLAPIAPGHTIPGAKETDQPPIWGYVGQYKVDRFGPKKTLGIVGDCYMKKSVEVNGETVSGKELLKEYPRRSIELWFKDNIIDWLALLKRSPMRDLGLTAAYAKLNDPRKLRYAMENDMDQDNADVPPVDDDGKDRDDSKSDLDDNAKATADKYWSHYMKTKPALKMMCDHYSAGNPGIPSPTNTSLPGDKQMTMSKEGDVLRYEKQVADAKAASEAAEKRAADLQARLDKTERLVRYERDLRELSEKGYEFDIAEELADVGDLAQEAFDKHKKRIETRYQKAPVGDDIQLKFAKSTSPKELSEAKLQEALQYMRVSGKNNIEEALAKVG